MEVLPRHQVVDHAFHLHGKDSFQTGPVPPAAAGKADCKRATVYANDFLGGVEGGGARRNSHQDNTPQTVG